MIKQFEFYKEDGRWYIDLPEWEGLKDDLEMVLGADALLVRTIEGRDWDDCMVQHHAAMNWEPYIPIDFN